MWRICCSQSLLLPAHGLATLDLGSCGCMLLIKNSMLMKKKNDAPKSTAPFQRAHFLHYIPATPWSLARPSASSRIYPAQWDGILSTHLFFFLLLFQSWYGERGGGQWVLNVPWQILAVQNWPSDSSSGGYAMPYSLRGHPVHGSEPCPNLTYRGIGWRSSWVWLHLQYKS